MENVLQDLNGIKIKVDCEGSQNVGELRANYRPKEEIIEHFIQFGAQLWVNYKNKHKMIITKNWTDSLSIAILPAL